MTQRSNGAVDEPVHLAAHDPLWLSWAGREISRLGSVLGLPIGDFEHIGSTAVPGLIAKPTIDIMLGVPVYPPAQFLSDRIQELEYEALGEAGVVGRLYFRRRVERSFNLHLVEREGAHWRRNLALRGLLRADPVACGRYAQAKLSAVRAGHQTLLAYSESKGAMVAELIDEAMRRVVV